MSGERMTDPRHQDYGFEYIKWKTNVSFGAVLVDRNNFQPFQNC